MNHGDIFKTKNFGSLTILKYETYHKVLIRFIDTGYETYARKDHILRGSVKDLLKPNVFNIGFMGDGPHVAWEKGKDSEKYKSWHAMMSRCYHVKTQNRQPTYKGCYVAKEWHNYQTFSDWYVLNHPNDGKKYHLDKDIKVTGNRCYSPDTCMFVSRLDNNAKSKAKDYVFMDPDGEVVHINNLKRFCKENELSYKSMHNITRSVLKRKQHKGWIYVKHSS